MAKKILIGIAGVLVLLALILAAVPMFYDVNEKLRPVIIEQIQSNLDAKAELGKLSLNLFGGVNVGIDSLRITENKTSNVLFDLKNAKLRIPYLSLLTGNIDVTLISDSPTINLVRYKDGSLNVTKIMKNKEQSPVDNAKNDGEPSAGAAFAASRVAFSTHITNAHLNFNDQQSGTQYKVEKLSLRLDKVGINRNFEFLISAAIDVNNKKDMKLLGTAELEGEARLDFGVNGVESIKIGSELDLSKLDIKFGNVLNKSQNIKLKIDTEMLITQLNHENQENVAIEKIEIDAGKVKINASGTVKNFSNPNLDLRVKSSEMNLKEWKDVILPIGQYDMSGTASLDLTIHGTTQKPDIKGSIALAGGNLKLPAMAQRVSNLNLNAQFSGERMTFQKASLNIGESDLNLKGYVENLNAPKIELDVSSNLLDLDKMMPAAAPAKKAKLNIINTAYAQDSNQADAEMRAAVQSIKSNPILQKMDLTANAVVKKLIVKSATITDLKADVYFKNLMLTIKNTTLKVFNGGAKAFFQLDFTPTAPSYQLTADMNAVDINEAVVSQFKDLDKFITGKANGNFIINGAGVEQAQIQKNIKGSGNFFIKDGAFSGAKPLSMLSQKVSSIPKLGEALSGVKISDRFKEFKVDFLIQSGALNIQKALMDMESAKTAMEATGKIDFNKNMSLKGNILAPIKDAPSDLKAGDGRGKIPFEIKGSVTSPEVEWERTLNVVAKAYAKDEGKKLIQKEAEKLIKDENVKKLFKNFKF